MTGKGLKLVKLALQKKNDEDQAALDFDACIQPHMNNREDLDTLCSDEEIGDIFSSGSSDLYEPSTEEGSGSSAENSSSEEDSSSAEDSITPTAYVDHEEVIGGDANSSVEASIEHDNQQVGDEISSSREETDAQQHQLDQQEGEEISSLRSSFPDEQPARQGEKRKLKTFPTIEKKSKKRKRNPDQWKRHKAALARMRGESYVSQKGKVIPVKKVNDGNLCKEKCRLKCNDNFEIREELFVKYHDLDTNAKNAFIFQSILSLDVQRYRKGAAKHRAASFKYMVTVNGRTVQVCKTAFCSLLQVGRKKIDCIIQKIKQNNSVPPLDQRGHHSNRPHKIHDDVKQYVREHIESFPAESSHYSRNINPHKKYLSPLLNLSKMHSLYLEQCASKDMPRRFNVKKCSYVQIFETCYNLSFGVPRSDTCSTCDSQQETDEHKENVISGFDHQKIDRAKARNSTDICYLTVDLQQTMPLPKITTSKAFYLRQMWFYNLGFHIISNKKECGVFCTWTEDVANRGSDEICSSLLTLLELDHRFKGKDHLIIWSDSCAGQNKNWQLVCLYQLLIKKQMFKIIDHKWPEVGHTYLDSDRDFGVIEKVLRKNEKIYSPVKYREIISSASRKNQVLDMTDHFRDFDCLDSRLRLINRKKDMLGLKVPFRDLRWLRVDEFGSYLFKECFLEHVPFRKVDVLRKGATPSAEGSSQSIPKIQRLKEHAGSLSDEKINDLKQQLIFIPEEFKWFYEKVIETNHGKGSKGKNKNKKKSKPTEEDSR